MPRPIIPGQVLHFDPITGDSYLVNALGERTTDMSIEEYSNGGLAVSGRNLVDLETGRFITRIGSQGVLQLKATESGDIGIFNAVTLRTLNGRGSRTGQIGIGADIQTVLSNGETINISVPFSSVTRYGSATLIKTVDENTTERFHMKYTGENTAQLQARLGPEYRYANRQELIMGGAYSYIRRHYETLFNKIARAGGIEGLIDPADSDSKMAWALASLSIDNPYAITSYLWRSQSGA